MKNGIGLSIRTLMIGLLLSLALNGCSQSRSGPRQAPVESMEKPTQQAYDNAKSADKPLKDAESATGKLPESPSKPQLISSLATIRAWYSTNLESWRTALASAKEVDAAIKKRDARIASLESQLAEANKSDPVKGWLTVVGIAAILIGAGGLIASFAISALFAFPWVRSASAGVLAFGFLITTIVRFMTAIYWIGAACIIAAVISGGIYLWTNRKILKSRVKVIAPKPV